MCNGASCEATWFDTHWTQPAVIVMTIWAMFHTLVFGMTGTAQLLNSWPLRATVMTVVDCRIASAIVRYRVYWVSVAVPAWPSWCSASNFGMTTRSSWTMMLAVMYGMMPSAKTDKLRSAPQLNRFARPSRSFAPLVSAMHWRTFGYETPGVGMNDPRRKMTMIAMVKSSLRRRSGVRKARTNALSTYPPAPPTAVSRDATADPLGTGPTMNTAVSTLTVRAGRAERGRGVVSPPAPFMRQSCSIEPPAARILSFADAE